MSAQVLFSRDAAKSIAILDEEPLLSVCAYIDLKPVAAGIAPTPEASLHTSVKAQVEHFQSSGRTQDLKAAECSSVAARLRCQPSLWHGLSRLPNQDN